MFLFRVFCPYVFGCKGKDEDLRWIFVPPPSPLPSLSPLSPLCFLLFLLLLLLLLLLIILPSLYLI